MTKLPNKFTFRHADESELFTAEVGLLGVAVTWATDALGVNYTVVEAKGYIADGTWFDVVEVGG